MDFKKQVPDFNPEIGRAEGRRYYEDLADILMESSPTTSQAIALARSINDPEFRRYFVIRSAYLFHSRKQTFAQCNRTPRFAQFALLLIPKCSREHLIGDLEEEFQTIVLPEYGSFWARCWYFEQVAIAIGCYVWPTIKKILGLSVLYKLIGR
jgi:hypothetical protein